MKTLSLSKSFGLALCLMIAACGGKEASPADTSKAASNGGEVPCGGYDVVRYPPGDPCPPTWSEAKFKCGAPCTSDVMCGYAEAGDGDSAGHREC